MKEGHKGALAAEGGRCTGDGGRRELVRTSGVPPKSPTMRKVKSMSGRWMAGRAGDRRNG